MFVSYKIWHVVICSFRVLSQTFFLKWNASSPKAWITPHVSSFVPHAAQLMEVSDWLREMLCSASANPSTAVPLPLKTPLHSHNFIWSFSQFFLKLWSGWPNAAFNLSSRNQSLLQTFILKSLKGKEKKSVAAMNFWFYPRNKNFYNTEEELTEEILSDSLRCQWKSSLLVFTVLD